MQNTAIIVTSDTKEQGEEIISNLRLGGITNQIIWVNCFTVNRDEDNVLCISVPTINKYIQKNIGRYFVKASTKYLLFVEDVLPAADINSMEEIYKSQTRTGGIIGAVGKYPIEQIPEGIINELYKDLDNIVVVDEESFKNKCCTKDGKFVCTKEEECLVSIDYFDKLGGYDINAANPHYLFCARLQLMGFGVYPL